MLRIVIVDDEILIREGLSRMIGKESSSFQVIGHYPDGKLLLKELPALQIDVVITDIRMPQVDGLELIKRLKASHPQIRSILMSGFVEFNYAREAIRSSAVDYLLKPINKEQLFELLYRLDEERQQRSDKEERQRSGLLLTLLQLAEPSPALLSSLTLPQPYFTLVVLKGSRETVCSCTAHLRRAQEAACDTLDIHGGLQVCVWYSLQPLTCGELRDIGRRIRSAAAGDTLHAGSSRSYTDTAMLRTAYLEAGQACDAGIYSADAVHYANIQDLRPPGAATCTCAGMAASTGTGVNTTAGALAGMGAADLFSVFREPLIHDLQILNVPGALDRVHQLFSALKSQQATPQRIVSVCRLVEDTARKELQEFEGSYEGSGLRLEEQLCACMNFSEIEALFTSLLSETLTKIRTHRLEMSGTAVETVKRWISANFNQHAELNTLANMVFLTPSYLSKLFKQETGLTLTDYMIEVRIRKAKQLLKQAPDLKIHEIGAEVGYADPAYFNKLFKRVVGVTPNEYKRISIV